MVLLYEISIIVGRLLEDDGRRAPVGPGAPRWPWSYATPSPTTSGGWSTWSASWPATSAARTPSRPPRKTSGAPFLSPPEVFALVAEAGDKRIGDKIIGIAVYFVSFSTWTGRHGLYLEDLFVVPEHRSRGVGRALLGPLAARAVGRGCARLEWAVLDWNQPAIDFYRSLGAVANDDWTTFRLSGAALAELGQTLRP